MKRVTIVGSGVAGMSAALRLLERGFHVRMFEQDSFVGGMLHSYEDDVTGTRREHSYHMFPNYYLNFWTIAEQLGLQNNFTPREAFRFLRGDDLANLPAIFNPGGPQQFLRNLASYAVPPPDLFIYMYSMIDMLAEPDSTDALLDKYSVNGFLHTKPYMTKTAAQLHQTLWETVWAISSYQASLRSYKAFVKYTNRYSVPELWLLAGNKWEYLMKPWLEKLESFGDRFELNRLCRLTRVIPDMESNRIAALEFVEPNHSPSVNEEWYPVGEPFEVEVEDDAVIMAVTPGAMSSLVKDEFFDLCPHLGQIKYIKAEPMGALQLYLNCKIKNLPKDVTDFQGAPYYMTFLDYTQLWPGQHNTFLYVTCSDVIELLAVPPERRDADNKLILDLDHPTTAIEYVLIQVMKHLPVDLEDIDLRATAYDMNTGEELFANMVGSWERRPETETHVDNLWLAGTYVRNYVDVATIEGGVVTGLQAAESIRSRYHPRSQPVQILEPEAFPRELFQALKVAWAPLAASAKVWSEGNTFMSRFGPAWDEAQKKFVQAAAKALQPLAGPVPNPPEYLGRLSWETAALDLPEDDPRRVGPLYWNYNRDGTMKAQKQPTGAKPGAQGFQPPPAPTPASSVSVKPDDEGRGPPAQPAPAAGSAPRKTSGAKGGGKSASRSKAGPNSGAKRGNPKT